MSELTYTLPLTERELMTVLHALACCWQAHDPENADTEFDARMLWERWRALEPIGTGGTTEGA